MRGASAVDKAAKKKNLKEKERGEKKKDLKEKNQLLGKTSIPNTAVEASFFRAEF